MALLFRLFRPILSGGEVMVSNIDLSYRDLE